ncbi:bestrophin family protein [Flagellimonas sp.]|uniref:bestrophin family protein n=1 Tax=Flagellimonas sp. TaxID=2058762 RepID=UPI003BA9C930
MIINRKIPLKFLLEEIKLPLCIVLFLGLVFGLIPNYFPDLFPVFPMGIPTTLGIAISILLSYKINQSYNRWWEARKIWGEIVNDSRSLVLQLQLYLNEDDALLHKISHYQIAWCYALDSSLRRQGFPERLETMIAGEDLYRIKKQTNIPLAINQFQTRAVRNLYENKMYDEFARTQLEETLTRLVASMGKCERIKNTVFPPTYGQTLNAAIYLFVIFLSLSSAFQLSLVLQIVILISISTVFFFLQKLAHSLQDPFHNYPTDTPMTSLSRTIEINIRQLLEEENIPEPLEPNKFYIM